MKKNKLSKSKKHKRRTPKNDIQTLVVNNKVFVGVLLVLIIIFAQLVTINLPVDSLDRKGLKFLNKYEYPTYLIETGSCMRPYDVGDGVVTFGPGITYQTKDQGIEAINQQLGVSYTLTDDCISTNDLLSMQKIELEKYERIVLNVEQQYNLVFTQDQFNGLVLLAYNSPNLFKNQQFIDVITNPQSTYYEYVNAADNYYRQLSGYDTKYGSGWYNRIKDSAEMYYFGDYRFQNNLEV